MSGLLSLVFTLDMTNVTHVKQHNNHHEDTYCKKTTTLGYNDDGYGIIYAHENNLWEKIKQFTIQMNSYFCNNKLKNNVTKTKIMLITNDKDLKTKTIVVEDKFIGHSNQIKILSTTFNE